MASDPESRDGDGDEWHSSKTDEEKVEENEISTFVEEWEAHPESRFADHYFTDDQPDCIPKHYQLSSKFLATHGLKFYDDQDRQEEVAIAKALMEDEDCSIRAPRAPVAQTG